MKLSFEESPAIMLGSIPVSQTVTMWPEQAIPVEFQQIEREQRHVGLGARPGAQQVEHRHPLLVAFGELAGRTTCKSCAHQHPIEGLRTLSTGIGCPSRCRKRVEDRRAREGVSTAYGTCGSGIYRGAVGNISHDGSRR